MDLQQNAVLSIVVPVYNEEETIPLFLEKVVALKREIIPYSFSFIFIDDGSTDQTLSVLRQINQQDDNVHYVSLSRHFGKEAAIYAGLEKAKGDLVALMDVDLQDPPELLPEMLSALVSNEVDCVATKRSDRRQESAIRSFFSSLFYKVMNRFSQTEFVEGARDFRMMNRSMVDAVLTLSENQRFSKGIFSWVGFRTKYLSYEDRNRSAGQSSWSFWGLFRYAVEGLVSFSTVPLTLVILLGFLTFTGSILAGIFIVIRALVSNSSVAGWPSMVTIILFIGGVQMLSIGVIGRYIAAIFFETKNRPIYLAKEEK
ncbi:glycosyltransferase family 2 protein [Fructobacillus sp. M1-13]|uniref:Glycosyltransferase family 2 protein n=1 Tax=Fructobacillus papyriferae TaxID=2713171 RepID=A0ABS5QP12_9LACO|nr:glycosyltransferase family 2 protein [Fructobacillus papyriferae]MBS9334893.1 glycosyltransferase family 2 protein [Fructobacillus papyriferae]MCD2158883.1 glycosyltransferase family 2 protein [Fructobacillus papyriferae]